MGREVDLKTIALLFKSYFYTDIAFFWMAKSVFPIHLCVHL